MEYQEVIERLEGLKLQLVGKLQNPNLSLEEKEDIQKSITNYDYIIELTNMNHYERGTSVH
ncbi:DUF3896 family protein [Bacillus dakarensis]|uniref:DUF3896 family protein n=1 Tax=Robertmurraya dakarensis TaxID=1926278 RepID=UPI000980DC58|nr:DUF3896 family protein [Bacillus dakarensis]